MRGDDCVRRGATLTSTGLRQALFTVLAIVTTTGYGLVDFGGWTQASQAMLLILMPIGAMAGSTAGGVKMIRVLAVASVAHRESLRQLHPRMIRPGPHRRRCARRSARQQGPRLPGPRLGGIWGCGAPHRPVRFGHDHGVLRCGHAVRQRRAGTGRCRSRRPTSSTSRRSPGSSVSAPCSSVDSRSIRSCWRWWPLPLHRPRHWYRRLVRGSSALRAGRVGCLGSGDVSRFTPCGSRPGLGSQRDQRTNQGTDSRGRGRRTSPRSACGSRRATRPRPRSSATSASTTSTSISSTA